MSGVGVLPIHTSAQPCSDLQSPQLPERTSWQDVKDFIKSQIPWKLDIYVSIFGKRRDSGWVRVIGFKAFNHVRRVLGESLFRGREILAHNPGYDEAGAGLVLVRAPFFRDRSLFINPEALAVDPTAGSAVQAAEEYITTTTCTTPTASNAPSEQFYPGPCQQVQPQVPLQPQATPPDLFPPTPPNTPKATRSASEPSLSGSRFRKLAITWREDQRVSKATPSTQEKMGSTIKAELAPLLSRSEPILAHGDPLETLECFPGTALATFSSHELARKAIKVLRLSARLNARPVVDEVPELTEKGRRVEGKKRGGKKGAGVGRTVSAPAVAEGGSETSQGKDKEKRGTASTANTVRKTPAVLIVNGSWKT
ncbi:hypothetical protein QBC45DRAFT_401837 [Copromyces sp. CBS 386.78]|nr:hypothetical protein QBC45DRAFT_401837 [Copromyces sp. CBS 386.78]